MEETSIDSLVARARAYDPDVNEARLRKAYDFAALAHDGQRRLSGEPYIVHPLETAIILAEMQLDEDTLVAALLHDSVEDTEVTLQKIEKEFGSTIARLVDGVTKLDRLQFRSRQEQQAETLRKMFLAMADDLRVVLIKLADRLHNMRTLKYQPPVRQKAIALETQDIFAPLAHRLGISSIQWELEDLALRYLEPDKYYEIAENVAQKRADREKMIERAMAILEEHLEQLGIKAEISGRPKNFFSIYRKMQSGKSFDEIYDLTALRIIVDSVKDCYEVLGLVHSLWKPIPGRFKDYIAMPKPNMYQSLHTTVIAEKGETLEIQIRTWEMHRIAENGVAAHWLYKEGGRPNPVLQEKLTWLRNILQWQQEIGDAQDFVEGVRIDLFADEVFVFTPKGDVIDLPAGSIPLDFAYRIHTDIGHHCVGAKVNGRIVPLNHALSTGDIVEILTSKQSPGPSRDWINMVRTPGAKSKIRAFFKQKERAQNVEHGQEIVVRELKRMAVNISAAMSSDALKQVALYLHFDEVEEMFSAVGYGGLSGQTVAARLAELAEDQTEEQPDSVLAPSGQETPAKNTTDGVAVKGLDNALIHFAHCCNPVPGDDIVGYVTRGRGVSVHTSTCPNLMNLVRDKERLIEVYWEKNVPREYPVKLQVQAMDRPGLLQELVAALSERRLNISAMQARTSKDGLATVDFTIVVRDTAQLEEILKRIERVRDVYTIRRPAQSMRHAGPEEGT
jgi:GTP pyrophosphokinase